MPSLRIRLLFFAVYRDLAGTSELQLELPAEPVVAVNREYASLATALRDGDELALLPPVAGG